MTAPQVLRSDPGLTVVLGGGGSAAVAWEIGVLAGLAERGLDVRGARRMIGTSAGSVVACRVARGTSWSDLLQWAGAPRTQAAVDVDFPALMARLTEIGSTAGSPAQGRQSIGALALAASTGSAEGRRGEIEELLGRVDWPDCDLVVTAVDARSGEFVTFTRDDGVALIDAVGASCAVPGVWPPVRIGDRAYVDGAVRSSVNASLAAGDPRVLVLAPQSGPSGSRSRAVQAWRRHNGGGHCGGRGIAARFRHEPARHGDRTGVARCRTETGSGSRRRRRTTAGADQGGWGGAMTGIEVSLGLWQDRPPQEVIDTARLADALGYPAVWIGEMATWDAFALGTHVGRDFTFSRLVLGPFAVTVRDPTMIAMGAASVAALTGRDVGRGARHLLPDGGASNGTAATAAARGPRWPSRRNWSGRCSTAAAATCGDR